jgi:hypothetical protein
MICYTRKNYSDLSANTCTIPTGLVQPTSIYFSSLTYKIRKSIPYVLSECLKLCLLPLFLFQQHIGSTGFPIPVSMLHCILKTFHSLVRCFLRGVIKYQMGCTMKPHVRISKCRPYVDF